MKASEQKALKISSPQGRFINALPEVVEWSMTPA